MAVTAMVDRGDRPAADGEVTLDNLVGEDDAAIAEDSLGHGATRGTMPGGAPGNRGQITTLRNCCDTNSTITAVRDESALERAD